jgi:hypothetical protein
VAVCAAWVLAVSLSSRSAPETHWLYGVPLAPATWRLLSLRQTRCGLLLLPVASLAMSVTHVENGVPGVPATCVLLSPWQ